MIIRRIVIVMGALIALVGLSQVAATAWWLRVTPSIMEPQNLRIFGIIVLATGVVLTIAAVRRIVRLRPLVLIMGLLMLIGGAGLLIYPATMKDTVLAYFMNRPHESLITLTRIGGLVRALLGIALVYAAARAPVLLQRQ